MAANITAIAVALIGASAGLIGLYFSRKGQRRSEAADAIAQAFDAQRQIFVEVKAERDELRRALYDCQQVQHQQTSDLAALRQVVAGQIVASAAITAAEDGDEEAEVDRIRHFLRTMREIG